MMGKRVSRQVNSGVNGGWIALIHPNEYSIVLKSTGHGARLSGLYLLRSLLSCVLEQVTKPLWASDDSSSKGEITVRHKVVVESIQISSFAFQSKGHLILQILL